MPNAYCERAEFREEFRGTKTPHMRRKERELGITDIGDWIVAKSTEGWTIAQIAQVLGCRPYTLSSHWCPRLGLKVKAHYRIVSG